MSAAQLKSMRKEIDVVLGQARTMAFIQVVRRHGEATLDDIVALAEEMDLRHLSIGDVLFDDLPRTGKDWAKQKALPSAKAANDGPNVRTLAGRYQYDQLVLKTLTKIGDWVGAQDIRDSSGGSPEQVRRSLNRLIESGRVEYTGQARATKYKVVA